MPKPPVSAMQDEVRRVVDALDHLLGEMSAGRPSPTRHDGHADQVVELGTRLIRAARGPGHAVNPPLARVGSGYLW